MHEQRFHAMGCQMAALLDTPAPADSALLSEVPHWFEGWEQCLSRFRDDSELSRLNRSAGQPFRVSEVLWEVLDEAVTAAQESAGLVTPALLTQLEAAGYTRSFTELASASTAPAAPSAEPVHREPAPPASPAPDLLKSLQREASTRTVRLLDGLRLDLGGVAKGWAADQAAQRLSQTGPALVDAGGDIAISGPLANGGAWPIGVANPFQPDADLDMLLVYQGGVATSGRDYRRWQREGVWYHHLLDARTGRPADTDVLAATVIAPTARDAEMAAKTALVLGSQAGLAWLDQRPHLAGLLVLADGAVLRSQSLAAQRPMAERWR